MKQEAHNADLSEFILESPLVKCELEDLKLDSSFYQEGGVLFEIKQECALEACWKKNQLCRDQFINEVIQGKIVTDTEISSREPSAPNKKGRTINRAKIDAYNIFMTLEKPSAHQKILDVDRVKLMQFVGQKWRKEKRKVSLYYRALETEAYRRKLKAGFISKKPFKHLL